MRGASSVSVGPQLLLPPTLEKAFWEDPSTQRVLYWTDVCGLLTSVARNYLSFSTYHRDQRHNVTKWGEAFGAWHPILLIFMNLLQLLVFFRAQTLYKGNRNQMTIANRVIRLIVVVVTLHTLTPRRLHGFLVTQFNKPHTLAPIALLKYQMWLPFVHILGMLCFPLPLRYAVVFQLATTLVQVYSAKGLVCAAALSPAFLAAAPMNCQILQLAAYALAGFPPALSGSSAAPDGAGRQQVCDGMTGLWLMQVFTSIVLIYLLPVVLVYGFELQAKRQFLATRGLQLSHTCCVSLKPGSWYVFVSVGLTLLSALWILLELVALQLGPRFMTS